MKGFLLLVFLFSGIITRSQDTLDSDYKAFVPGIDLSYNHHISNEIEAGINFMTYDFNLGIFLKKPRHIMEFGVFAACGYNFLHTGNVLAPKVALGMNFQPGAFGLALKLNLTDYDPGRTNDFRFTPQAGFTFIGIINVYYGYNLALTETSIKDIGTHSITVNLCFNYSRMVYNALNAAGGL